MKVLINVPSLSLLGGVSNHFLGLENYWSCKFKYNTIGSRFRLNGIILLPFDFLAFMFNILTFNPDLILLNPSLNPKAYYRDSLYLLIAKIFSKKVIVFFHGWDIEFEDKLNKSAQKKRYHRADAIIVLAKSFKNKLLSWGYQGDIFLTTTKVEEAMILDPLPQKNQKKIHLLFFGRIETKKGIFIALDAFKNLYKNNKNITLEVVGSGSELKTAKLYCKSNAIENVTFHGRLSGSELTDVLKKCQINIFPTHHGEGMPTSVLESMAFGHTIVTRPVGGLVDFFKDDKMGYFVQSLKPEDFEKAVVKLLENSKHLSKIEKFNYKFAKKNFTSSVVAKQLEYYFSHVLSY